MESFNGRSSSDGTADFPIGQLIVSLPSQGASEFGGDLWLLLKVDAIDGVQLAEPLVTASPVVINGTLHPNGEWYVGYGASGDLARTPHTPPYPISDGFQYGGIGHHILLPSNALWITSDREFSLDSQLLSVSAANVPEPSTWVVFSALTLVAWRARKR